MNRNELVEKHLRLVHWIVHQYTDTDASDYDDLVNEGVLGLIDAADRYRPERGLAFSTYAAYRVRKYVLAALPDHVVRTPRRRTPLKREPLEDIFESSDVPIPDALADIEHKKAVDAAIKQLPHREAIVIRLRYGIDCERMTLEKIGKILAVTSERVRQIQVSAENNLRKMMQQCKILLEDYETPEQE